MAAPRSTIWKPYEQKEVPATVVACAAVVTVGGPGFCRGATCRVRSGSMSLFECHNIYTKLGELEEGPHRGRCLQLHWPGECAEERFYLQVRSLYLVL